MGVVDFTFYNDVYKGNEADQTSFPAFCARASDIVGAMAHWAVDETTISRLPAKTQELYRKAICAQIDFFALNGLEAVNDAGNGGFTVGKVTVHGRQNDGGIGGSLAASIAPMAKMYLEQTGLTNPAVPCIDTPVVVGWW